MNRRTGFIIAAVVLLWLASAGVRGNAKFMKDAKNLPADPARRTGYMVGLYTPPVLLLVGAVTCGVLAVRQKRR